ncbi:MAG: prolyl oligopeptidase family serine peptidase [Gemmatimonadota bacterium]|jgi:dipeptidyl aminopeptidase/acylaminoacyl peptidase
MHPNLLKRLPARGVFLSCLLAVGLALPTGIPGQTWDRDQILTAEGYQQPPDTIAEAVLAPWYLNVTLSEANADKSLFLNEIGDGPVTMDVFSKPFHELGGLFIDFAANRDRNLTIRNNVGIEIISALDGSKTPVQVPDGARVSNATWSPDGTRIAFFVHTPTATHLYVADASNGRSRQLTRRPVLATEVTSFQWTDDSRYIGTVLVPEDRPDMPAHPAAPQGPEIKVTEDGKNILRTYASLMATPYDQALLEWHLTGQLALIQVDNRRVTNIGQPDMIRSLDFAPDGAYVRVTRTVKPFSYIVPVSSFGSVEEVWDRDGNVLTTLDESELNTGLRDDRPVTAPGVGGEAAESDRRDLGWRADGAGLTYLEQEPAPDSAEAAAEPAEEPGQEGRTRSRRMDRVYLWAPPFDSTSKTVVYETSTRMSWHRFSPDMQVLFAAERSGQDQHIYAVDLNDPEEKHTLVRYSSDDFYANPGSLMTARGGSGGGGFGGFGRRGGGAPGQSGATIQLSADGQAVFFQGTEYNEDPDAVAPKSFIDRVAIRTGEKTRIFEGDNDGVYERVLTPVDLDAGTFIVSREGPTEVPQSYRLEGGQPTQLTHNVDYAPDITGARQERFVVTRPDGFKFRVTVTLPPGFREGSHLPAMFWFYPREYTDQESYDEGARTYNKNAFPNFGTRSMQYLIRLGYVLVEPDAPIVGEEGAMNNHYEYDLRNDLSTVIDSIEARGYVDRSRLGIGGHSYGAFSTANAMVHTPFFKAGIAGDGNYNRTLTPLAFQNERRFLWDAKDVYLSMSPFLYADQLTGALLMYHGMHDQNVGTDPIHSPKMFHALNGLGKTAALYRYPYEDHGPAAKETLLDLWARWTAWLDKWIMNPAPPAEGEEGK